MSGGGAANPLVVRAPLPGRVVAMLDVPDQVFAQELVGPGLAIDAGTAEHVDVPAPVDGVVSTVFPHAFAITAEDSGRSVLVHLGIDTVGLRGDGFAVSVRAGDRVRAGHPMIAFSPRYVTGQGLSTVCPVVGVQAAHAAIALIAEPGRAVQVGAPLFSWA